MTAKQQPPTATLWRNADFVRLWSAQSVSQLGAHVTLLAMPLVAVLLLGAKPFQLGVLTAVEYLPFLLVGLPAGVWVDRLPRRAVLLAADFGRAVILLLVPLAYYADKLSIELLYGVAFCTGVLTVFFDVAYQAYLPSLVSAEQLVDGNTKLEFSRSSADLAGPSLGGFVFQWFGAAVALLANVATYLLSASALLMIRKRDERPVVSADEREGMIAGIRDGLRFVFGNPLLRSIAFCTALSNLFGLGGAVQALLTLYASTELKLSPGELGLTMAIGNVGAFAGVFAGSRLVGRFGLGPTLIGSILSTGVGTLILPLGTTATGTVVVASAMALVGAGSTVYNVNQVSLRQTITAEGMQGRMNATMRFAVWGTIPLGALLGGTLGSLIGVRPTLWIVGVAGLFSCVPLLFAPVRTLRFMPTAPAPAPATETPTAPLPAQ